MQKIYPCLCFNNQAEEAVKFYASVFKDTKILKVGRYGKNQPGPEGQVMMISFKMRGQQFLALNAGPLFKFTGAVSLVVNCKTQAEVDQYWKKLLRGGGREIQCGWLEDKFGLSWQVVPEGFEKYVASKNPKKAQAAMQAMMKMIKLDLRKIKKAHDEA